MTVASIISPDSFQKLETFCERFSTQTQINKELQDILNRIDGVGEGKKTTGILGILGTLGSFVFSRIGLGWMEQIRDYGVHYYVYYPKLGYYGNLTRRWAFEAKLLLFGMTSVCLLGTALIGWETYWNSRVVSDDVKNIREINAIMDKLLPVFQETMCKEINASLALEDSSREKAMERLKTSAKAFFSTQHEDVQLQKSIECVKKLFELKVHFVAIRATSTNEVLKPLFGELQKTEEVVKKLLWSYNPTPNSTNSHAKSSGEDRPFGILLRDNNTGVWHVLPHEIKHPNQQKA